MNIAMTVFIACGVMAIVGALALILAREPVHSALALVLVMISLAILYLLLGAAFIAAIQILVYAGAIMVLFVFVIMLLNAGEEVRTNVSRLAKWVGLPLGIFFLAEMTYSLFHEYGNRAAASGAAAPDPQLTQQLSMKLFTEFVLPFELTSILILIAVLGALVLAKRES
ncbi:MAG: NADH-quinone oxidoreductase subunit J [Candidatus Acidiferrales bacterium]|jgi:NADH-quinone oxidoreductase subunit J|nr:NADH-quinone oxidoreductase subunit J [Candidatus Acidoferrales bacterium]